MVSQKSIILKLMRGYKPLEVKNKDNLIEVELLLFATNFTISNLSD